MDYQDFERGRETRAWAKLQVASWKSKRTFLQGQCATIPDPNIPRRSISEVGSGYSGDSQGNPSESYNEDLMAKIRQVKSLLYED